MLRHPHNRFLSRGLTCVLVSSSAVGVSACRTNEAPVGSVSAGSPGAREERAPTAAEVAAAQRAMSLGDDHMQAGRWRAAVDAYADALELWPENREAARGLGDALARLDQHSGLDRVAEEWSILHQQTLQLFDRRLETARSQLDREEMDAAERTVIHARVDLERNREFVTDSELRVRQRAAEDLLHRVGRLRERIAQLRHGG